MKIAIDLSQILYGTGVSHYRENLVKNLLKIDEENEYLLFGGSLRRGQELKTRIEKLGTNNKTTVKIFPFPPTLASLVWNKLHILPIEKIIGNIDLIHTSDWAEPPSMYPKVTTIHDLIPLKFPKVTPPAIVAAHKDRLKWVKKESKKIIVPSQTTKNDLIEFGFDENIIKVIYEAPNLKKASEQEIIAAKSKYRIHDDYIIAIGTNPRKNIDRIIDAYNLAKSGKNIKLLIVGEKRSLRHEDQRGVRFLGFVPDYDLGPLLTGSKALIFPSIYEGLGIPILDGFNCEVPVVTSNIGSMKEISEDASILVDPYDVNSISDGIKKALETPKTLITKGLEKFPTSLGLIQPKRHLRFIMRYMKNSLFLDYYQHLQYGIVYNKLIDLGFASIAYSSDISSPVFNLAWVDKELTEGELTVIEKELEKLGRTPSIYSETRPELDNLRKFLEEKGYTRNWEDSWMFFGSQKIDKSRFSNVKKVEDEKDLEVYLKTFDSCYQKDDPQNPYGELGDYLISAKNCWMIHNKSNKVEYFIVYKNNIPVAVSTLTNFAGIGYISNVGSLREVRGEGFGKLATLYCVEKSRENKNTEHCLATEENQYPNEFYKRIGFSTRFTVVGFVKD